MSNEVVRSLLAESAQLKQTVLNDDVLVGHLTDIADRMLRCHHAGGTLYMCGNGGSACDAMHFCEELVARYKREREGIRAIHFLDAPMMTCWANDYTFESQFARYAEVFCTDKDMLFGFSTSGNSKNVCEAIDRANAKGTYTIGFSGKTGGALAEKASCCLIVPSEQTERIQEVHITFVHILCELVERTMLGL